MVYNIVVKPEAYLDIDDAMDWYQKQQAGLEIELYHEIFDCRYPKNWDSEFR